MELSLPTLHDGDDLVLRPMSEDDAPAYAAAFRDDPDLGRLLGLDTDLDEGDARARIAEHAQAARAGRYVELAVETADLPFAGTVTAVSLNERHLRCEVGYWLVPAARGRGLARTAAALLTEWAFATLPLDRLEITTTPGNAAALRLAAAIGFEREGVMRARNFERGRPVDLVMLARLRDRG
jgi:RimJ/RimL family protein N-acetyltransferase